MVQQVVNKAMEDQSFRIALVVVFIKDCGYQKNETYKNKKYIHENKSKYSFLKDIVNLHE